MGQDPARPEIPPDVVAATRARYIEVYEPLTGVDPRWRNEVRDGSVRVKGEFACLPDHEAGLRLTAARRALTALGLWTDAPSRPRFAASDGTVTAAT